MPNAVLEAMASGLPVIATRIAGNEELVVDGETGRLVPTEDVESLQESLRPLLVDGRCGSKWDGRVPKSQSAFSWNQSRNSMS